MFARQIGIKRCFTPISSAQSNGNSEASVKTLKRDYIQSTSLPDAESVLGLIGRRFDISNEEPTAHRTEDAFATRVHCSSKCSRLSVR